MNIQNKIQNTCQLRIQSLTSGKDLPKRKGFAKEDGSSEKKTYGRQKGKNGGIGR